MVYGLWQSAAGLQVQDYRQTVLANNLANADTTAFKADRVSFIERLNAARTKGGPSASELGGMTGGLLEAPLFTDFSQASLVPSESKFDLAIQGEGFFKVQTKDGVRVTRDGQTLLNKDGMLVHASTGGAMLDVSNRPIYLNPTQLSKMKVDTNGVIRQGESIAGQLALVEFDDPQKLQKEGKNLFSTDGARATRARGEVRQNYTEGSGVEPVTELVDLMAASRAYQLNATMISLQDESLGRVVNQLGRIG